MENLTVQTGHMTRMSSLPSIDEDDIHTNHSRKRSHRRLPSSKPRFSLQSIHSTNTSSSVTSKDLLSNMMTSYTDADPYDRYVVLDDLGEGSIGSVQKVVRRHHHHHHGYGQSNGVKSGVWFGGIFHSCCVNDKKDHVATNKPWFFLSSFFRQWTHNNNKPNAFQPSHLPTGTSSPSTDSNRSNLSENSAFSAPTFSRNNNNNNNSTHSLSPYNSIRSDDNYLLNSHHHQQPHHKQHTRRIYALKSIRLDRTQHNGRNQSPFSTSDISELKNEISILRSLDHPHIVHIIETYEYHHSIYLVLDLCEGGDLYVQDPYTEREARLIVRQLGMAMGYMHRRGVVHRDLKYENVMFVERGGGGSGERGRMSIKLIDFGLSMKYGGNKNSMTDFVGTIYTMAPEVIRGSYNHKCDLWSLGVMTYMLLSSQIPFVGRDMSEIAKEIMRGRYSCSGRKWKHISEEGKDFIRMLLVKDVGKRADADQAMKHPWLQKASSPKRQTYHRRHSSDCIGGSTSKVIAPHLSLDIQICQSIERFSTYSWLHRLALMVIGYQYTGREISVLREVFSSFDYKNTGTVEVDELRYAFALYDKYSGEEMDEIFAAVDMNGIGVISWTEFLAATIETTGSVGEEEFSECFNRLDCDSSGYISTENLKEILGDLPDDVFDRIIDESDLTRDQKIWRHEFMELLDERSSTNNLHNDARKPLHFVFKRSNSADDLDFLTKFNSDFPMSDVFTPIKNEVEEKENVDDVFVREKAKSVRKMSKKLFS